MSNGIFADDRGRALFDAARGLVAELELETVLEDLLDAACRFTGAQYAAIGIMDRDRRRLERFVTRGMDDATRRTIGDLPRGRGLLGVLIEEPKPVRLENVGEHPRSYGFPPGHPPMRSFLGVPIVIGREPWGNLYLTDKQGGTPFEDADEEAAMLLAQWSAIAVANARNFEASEQRRGALEKAVRALEATTDIALAVGGETDLDRILELVAKRGRALVSSRSLLVHLVQRDDLVMAAGAGELQAGVVGTRVPLAESAVQDVIVNCRPVRVSDIASHLRWSRAAEATSGATEALVVPLLFRGRALGAICAFDRLAGEQPFGPDDERLLTAFAATAATAVAGAQAVAGDRVRTMLDAEEHERARWARELHDDTLQELAALGMGLESALGAGGEELLRIAVQRAVDHSRRQVSNLRGLITDLRPADLDQLGVGAALEALGERMTDVHGLDVVVRVELRWEDGAAATRLKPVIEATTYRLTQEALTNTAKHAAATSALVSVVEDDRVVKVTVSDDGHGFEVGRPHAGFGLSGMIERVELAGGKIQIASSSAGTRLEAVLPALRSSAPPGEASVAS